LAKGCSITNACVSYSWAPAPEEINIKPQIKNAKKCGRFGPVNSFVIIGPDQAEKEIL
jgi:hypothetical protein